MGDCAGEGGGGEFRKRRVRDYKLTLRGRQQILGAQDLEAFAALIYGDFGNGLVV